MKNYYSDFSSQPKFTRYYGLNNFPEAHFLIEAECFESSVDTINKTKSSAKGILFALGAIITLVVLSVFQLYIALEVVQSSPKITKSRESSNLDTEKSVHTWNQVQLEQQKITK